MTSALALAPMALSLASTPPVDRDGNATLTRALSAPTRVVDQARSGGVAGDPVSEFVSLDVEPEGDMPRSVAVTPDGSLAAVVNRDSDLLVLVDLATVTIVASIPVGDYPIDVAVSGDGAFALTANALSHTVSVIDLAARSHRTDIPISGEQPYRILATDDGTRAVVGVINDAVSSSFSIIDLASLTEERTIPSTPQGVIGFFFTPAFAISGELTTPFDVTPDGSMIVLPWRAGATVTLYDVATGATVATLPTAVAPSAVDIASDGSIAAVVHDGPPASVSVIDLPARAVTANHPIASSLDPFIARVTPNASHVLAASLNTVLIIDLATGATAASVQTGTVGDIEISADAQYAFVSNFNAAVIDLDTRTLVKTMPFGACADAAASPSTNLAVALNNRFREEIYVYTLDGAASAFKGFTRSGPAPEADAPKEIALSPDGATALISNATSRNVTFLDVASGIASPTVDTGDVPRESAFTPDGAYALVCNGDSNTTSVIDVATRAVVQQLATGQRPARVRVAPDGTEAYVASIAGADALWFVEIDGAKSAISGSLPIGQLGAANGYAYSEISGMELSADGSLLAVAVSFDDLLRVVDTASRTVVANVPVGDFPIRVLFDEANERVFVANSFSDDVHVVSYAGGLWFVEAIIPGIDFPLDMALDSDGEHLYVGSCGFQAPAVAVVNISQAAVVATIPLSDVPREGEYIAARDEYVTTTNDGTIVRIDAKGVQSAVIETIAVAGSPPDLKYSSALDTLLATAPAVPDGVDVVSLSTARLLGDLDGDGDVDAADLALLLGLWGPVGLGGAGDLDGDGVVDAADLAILLGAWTG